MSIRALIVAAVLIVTPMAAFADGTDAYIELFRSDLRADKQAIVTIAMELSDADSEKFWPVYREFEAENIVLGDRTIALLKKYTDAVQVTGPETLDALVQEFFKLQDDRSKLMKKYYGKASKQISSRVAALWMQVEHRIWLLVQLQIASEVPLIGPAGK